jgi:hypothetical protein
MDLPTSKLESNLKRDCITFGPLSISLDQVSYHTSDQGHAIRAIP